MKVQWAERAGEYHLQQWSEALEQWHDVPHVSGEGEQMPLGLGLGSEIGKNDAATGTVAAVSPLAYSQESTEAANHYQASSYSPAIGTGDATISGWVLPRLDNVTCVLFHTGSFEIDPVNAKTGVGFGVLVEVQSNRLHVRVADGTAHIDAYSAANSLGIWSSGLDDWYHWLVTMDRSGDLTIYIDGSSSGTPAAMSTVTSTITGVTTDMAMRHDSVNGLIGNYAGVRVFNAALSTAERAEDYNAGDGALYSSLSASLQSKLLNSWDLQQASGVAVDEKGTQNLTAIGVQSRVNGPSAAITALSRVNLSSYDDFANAITTIGSDVEILNIDESTNLAAQATVPSNITIQFTEDSLKIETFSSQNLIIEGGIYGEYSGTIGGLERLDLNSTKSYIWMDWSDAANDWDKRDEALTALKDSSRKKMKLPRRIVQYDATSSARWNWDSTSISGITLWGDDRDDCVLQGRTTHGHIIYVSDTLSALTLHDFCISADATGYENICGINLLNRIHLDADYIIDDVNISRIHVEKMFIALDVSSHNGVYNDLLLTDGEEHGYVANHGLTNTVNRIISRDHGSYGIDHAGGFHNTVKHDWHVKEALILDCEAGAAKIAFAAAAYHYHDITHEDVVYQQTIAGTLGMQTTGDPTVSNVNVKMTWKNCTFSGPGQGTSPESFGLNAENIGTIVLEGTNTIKNWALYGFNLEVAYKVSGASYNDAAGDLTTTGSTLICSNNGTYGLRLSGDNGAVLNLASATFEDNEDHGIVFRQQGGLTPPKVTIAAGTFSGNGDYAIEGPGTVASNVNLTGITFDEGAGCVYMTGSIATDTCKITSCTAETQTGGFVLAQTQTGSDEADFSDTAFEDGGSNTGFPS